MNAPRFSQTNAIIDLVSDDDDDDEEQDANTNPIYAPYHNEPEQDPFLEVPNMHDRRPVVVGSPQQSFNRNHDAHNSDASMKPGLGGHEPSAVWGDYFMGDLDDEAVMKEFLSRFDQPEHMALGLGDPSPSATSGFQVVPDGSVENDPSSGTESSDACIVSLSNIFPDIDPEYVADLYSTISKSSERLIQHVLDRVEKGFQYPKAKELQSIRKRKRDVDEDEELIKKYSAIDRVIPSQSAAKFIVTTLGDEFPTTPKTFINATLKGTGYRLFPAYRVLEEAERTFNPQNPPYNKIRPRKVEKNGYQAEMDIHNLMQPYLANNDKEEIEKELKAAKKVRQNADAKRKAERDAETAEEANTAKAEAEGTMGECGCCYCEYPLNRMVHCNGEMLHWFCKNCARRNAEEEIGKSKYELLCMSTDKCEAKFAMDQRNQFLDENTKIALERNEQESNLRLAGIENLASCPFCPFAAEYPSVAVDREFRCQAPDCEKVSCRLCRLESHIPKSCEEHAKESGLSIRRQIEEAMSAALIRKCNKCSTPFVKEEGCNKMTCTRNGCYNIQCYVCAKSCGYDHFDDVSRGGRTGNCPLFESVEERHNEEVSRAEKDALQKALADHPEYSEEDLKIRMLENVATDHDVQKSRTRIAHFGAVPGQMVDGPRG